MRTKNKVDVMSNSRYILYDTDDKCIRTSTGEKKYTQYKHLDGSVEILVRYVCDYEPIEIGRVYDVISKDIYDSLEDADAEASLETDASVAEIKVLEKTEDIAHIRILRL